MQVYGFPRMKRVLNFVQQLFLIQMDKLTQTGAKDLTHWTPR